MKLNMKKFYQLAMAVVIGLTLVRCGGQGSGGTIRIVINNRTHELALTNTRCNAGQPTGTGLYNLPVQCSAGFANTTGLSDSLSVLITDARAVQDALGVFIPISPSLLIMTITLDGTQLAITTGGAQFSSISNTTGGTTSFDFVAETAQAHFEGDFTGTTSIGY